MYIDMIGKKGMNGHQSDLGWATPVWLVIVDVEE